MMLCNTGSWSAGNVKPEKNSDQLNVKKTGSLEADVITEEPDQHDSI